MGLAQEPRLLLLDEPTAGMARHDTNATIDLLKKIKAGGHDQGHHRARHARRVQPRRPDHRARRRTHHLPGHARRRSRATRASRKPIWARSRSDGHETERDRRRGARRPRAGRARPGTRSGRGASARRLLRRLRAEGLLRRQLHRPGRLVHRERGRDRRAAGQERRGQDVHAARDRARRLPRRCAPARSGCSGESDARQGRTSRPRSPASSSCPRTGASSRG